MKTIIIGGFSGIGLKIIDLLEKDRNEIIYTYNSSFSTKLKKYKGFKLNISSLESIDNFVKQKSLINWDNLIIMPATQKPIGLFSETNPRDWVKSIET